MEGYILRDGKEQLTLSTAAADKLLQSGQGDAALLYLALCRFGRGVTPEELERALPISRLRIDAAERVLQQLGILPRPAEDAPPAPAEERPVYTSQDIAGLLTDNEGFRLLIPQTEQQLGKKLRTADLQILAGLYDQIGMPADVIYLLVCHCVERARRQWGEGRRPTLRQIEKEGAYWARLGLMDQDSAGRYLKDYARKQEKTAAYMQVLQLHGRPPVESEQRYILDWIDMGFPPETVALAYDKTVFYKKELNWRYLNGILRRWHQQGWHTVEQVEEGQQRAPKKSGAKPAKTDWMDEYM